MSCTYVVRVCMTIFGGNKQFVASYLVVYRIIQVFFCQRTLSFCPEENQNCLREASFVDAWPRKIVTVSYLAEKISEHELSMRYASVHDDIWGRETICRELFGVNRIFQVFFSQRTLTFCPAENQIVCERPFSLMLGREK